MGCEAARGGRERGGRISLTFICLFPPLHVCLSLFLVRFLYSVVWKQRMCSPPLQLRCGFTPAAVFVALNFQGLNTESGNWVRILRAASSLTVYGEGQKKFERFSFDIWVAVLQAVSFKCDIQTHTDRHRSDGSCPHGDAGRELWERMKAGVKDETMKCFSNRTGDVGLISHSCSLIYISFCWSAGGKVHPEINRSALYPSRLFWCVLPWMPPWKIQHGEVPAVDCRYSTTSCTLVLRWFWGVNCERCAISRHHFLRLTNAKPTTLDPTVWKEFAFVIVNSWV